jgi:hypothetical protein
MQAHSAGECMSRWHMALSTVLCPGVAMSCPLLPLPVTPELPAMQPALVHHPAFPLHHLVQEGCRHRPWGPCR